MVDIHAYLSFIDKEASLINVKKDMKRFNISKRIISPLHYSSLRQANNELLDLLKTEDDLFVSVRVNPKDIDAEEYVRDALGNSKVVMFEFDSFEDGYYPDVDQRVRNIMDVICEHPKPIKVFTGLGSVSMPHQWEVIAKLYPELTFILLHCGCFDYGYSCVDVVDRNSNLLVETSNQYELQILTKMFRNLNPDKIVFGTSYGKRLTRSAIEVFDNYELSDEAKDKIFEKNTLSLIGGR